MNFKLFFFIVFLGFSLLSQAQSYVIYDVKPSDTPQSIAQENSISLQQLYKYNPDLRNTQSIDKQKIVIPKSNDKNFGLLRYRVKTKETLYSLSRNYNLSIADIKAFNPQLYDNELRAGEVLKLPVYKLPERYQNLDFNQSIKNSNFSAFKHIVLPGERKSDIVAQYGMSLQSFDSINKNMINVNSGQLVNVIPNTYDDKKSLTDADVLDMNLQYYQVPRRQTLYSLSKEFKISEEIIFRLNPIVRREGLKAGMIIKLPERIEVLSEKIQIVDLENYIQNFNEKKLALFLPFSFNQFENDSIEPKTILMRDNLLNISLDFYEGVQWAIDEAKAKGIYTDLKVFDTKRNPVVIDNILSNNNLSDRDAFIGPILDKSIIKLSQDVKSENIPIFLPITKSESASSSIINTLVDKGYKTETLITLIDSTHQNQNLIFITDSTAQQAYEKYKYTYPNAQFYQPEKTYLESEEFEKLLNPDHENWIILETNQLGMTESVVNNAYKYKKGFIKEESEEEIKGEKIQFDIKLFTSDRNGAFREVLDNKALCELNFTYTSESKYDVLESNELIESYKTRNGHFPSRFVLRAFDLTYDILLRLAYEGNLQNKTSLSPYTEYNENRFIYTKPFLGNVYENKALYIIQYLPDFEIEVLNSKKNSK